MRAASICFAHVTTHRKAQRSREPLSKLRHCHLQTLPGLGQRDFKIGGGQPLQDGAQLGGNVVHPSRSDRQMHSFELHAVCGSRCFFDNSLEIQESHVGVASGKRPSWRAAIKRELLRAMLEEAA